MSRAVHRRYALTQAPRPRELDIRRARRGCVVGRREGADVGGHQREANQEDSERWGRSTKTSVQGTGLVRPAPACQADGADTERRAVHGRRRRAAKQWAEGILPTRCPPRRPREAADPLHLPLVAGFRRCEAPDRPAAGCTGETGRRSLRRTQIEAARGATGRRASHGRRRRAAKQWAEGIRVGVRTTTRRYTAKENRQGTWHMVQVKQRSGECTGAYNGGLELGELGFWFVGESHFGESHYPK